MSAAPVGRQFRCFRSLLAALRLITAVAVFSAIAPTLQAQMLTADQAVDRAQQQVPGKLVAVSKEQQGEQTVYRVRILGADGVVRTVFINAEK
jgi:Peptidase propeptide and YPEB domain